MSRKAHRALLIVLALAALAAAAAFAPRVWHRARVAWRIRMAPWQDALGKEHLWLGANITSLDEERVRSVYGLADDVLTIANTTDKPVWFGKELEGWTEYALELDVRARGEWAFLGRFGSSMAEQRTFGDQLSFTTQDGAWTKVEVRVIDGRYETFVDGEAAGEGVQSAEGNPGGWGVLVAPKSTLEVRAVRAKAITVDLSRLQPNW